MFLNLQFCGRRKILAKKIGKKKYIASQGSGKTGFRLHLNVLWGESRSCSIGVRTAEPSMSPRCGMRPAQINQTCSGVAKSGAVITLADGAKGKSDGNMRGLLIGFTEDAPWFLCHGDIYSTGPARMCETGKPKIIRPGRIVNCATFIIVLAALGWRTLMASLVSGCIVGP